MEINIPLYKPYITDLEKKYVNKALDSGWISSRGEFVEKFEDKVKNLIGRKYAISTCNGTVALHLALEALELPKGSIVLCPTLTYVATANAIRQAGLIPLFVDCNSYGISELKHYQDGYSVSDGNVSAIMTVDLYGEMVDIESLRTYFKNIPIIEDCAESLGSHKYHQYAGGSIFSDIACFSFFGNKTITCGEGGMVVCNDKKLYEKCQLLRNVGQAPGSGQQRYQHLIVGYNYRMTNIAAAIGCAQMENLQKILELKWNVFDYYWDCLHDLIRMDNHCGFLWSQGINVNHWLVTLILRNNSEREAVMLHLRSLGIDTRPVFMPMHMMTNLHPFFKPLQKYSDDDVVLPKIPKLLMAEDISSRGLNLPSYPELSKEEVIYICKEILKCLNKIR